MNTTKKKILFILMPDGFQDHEFIEPYNALAEAGHNVLVAGFSLDEAVGALGLISFTPELLFDQLKEEELGTFDALVIPGGPSSTTYLWHNEALQELLVDFHARGALIATICYACIVPVEAGLVTGKEITVYPTTEAKELLAKHNVLFIDKKVVVLEHEKMIFGQGPRYAQEFAEAILAELAKE